MSVARNAVIVLLVVLLALDLAAANAVVAADRTVLNPDFVTTTLEEEGAYEQAEPIVVEQLPTDELEAEGIESLPIDPEQVARAALDATYLQSQIEPNIEAIYAYLHGSNDQLELLIDLEPAKDAIVDAVVAELTNASASELVGALGDETTTSFEAEGFTFDLATVAAMAEDEETFTAERQKLRAVIRDRVLTRLVDRAFQSASDDELLALVIEDYNPDDYTEEEKDQLVSDNEPEIRAELRSKIEAERGDEIDAAVDRELADRRQEIRAEVKTNLNASLDAPPEFAEPMVDLALVAVDGYVADISHDEFSAQFEAAADELAVGAGALLDQQVDEQVPDELDLTEELDTAARQNLEQAREVVGYLDLLAVGLPILGLVLIGLLYLVSKSIAVTAIGGGLGLVIGGLPGLIAAGTIRGRLSDALAGSGLPAGLQDLALAVAGQVADAVMLQSGAMAGVGVLVLLVGLALHSGAIEPPGSTTPTAAEAESAEPESADAE